MKRILLTGMSGTGKSSVILELARRGYKAVDLDEPAWSDYTAEGSSVWRADRVRALLATEDADVLFISGTDERQRQFYPQLDHVILLSAPADVLMERLRTRTTNPYGKDPKERAEVLGYLATVEPLLRRGAGYEIDTTMPLDQVVETVLRVVEG